MIKKISAYGSQVIVFGKVWDEADQKANEIIREKVNNHQKIMQ